MPQYGDGKGNVVHEIIIRFPAGQDIPAGWVIVGGKAAKKALEDYGIKDVSYLAKHHKERPEEIKNRERIQNAIQAHAEGKDTLSEYGISFTEE